MQYFYISGIYYDTITDINNKNANLKSLVYFFKSTPIFRDHYLLD